MHKELRAGREELFRIGGIGSETNRTWQDVILNLQDELEAQKQEQRRIEDRSKTE